MKPGTSTDPPHTDSLIQYPGSEDDHRHLPIEYYFAIHKLATACSFAREREREERDDNALKAIESQNSSVVRGSDLDAPCIFLRWTQTWTL